jgi:hypothetical protein
MLSLEDPGGTAPSDFLGILYFFLTGIATIGVEWVRRKVLKNENAHPEDHCHDCDSDSHGD